METLKVLTELTSAPGVSGHETQIRAVVERYFKKYSDDIRRDTLGNLFCHIGSGKPIVMLTAHMDEIGMAVSYIEENGMLRLASTGSIDPRVLPGCEVVVYGKRTLCGVLGIAPQAQHIAKPDYAYTVEDIVCDLGLSVERIKEAVSIGDFVIFEDRKPVGLKDRCVAGKNMDGRALVAVLIEVLDMLSKRRLNCTVVCVATVQGKRGRLGIGPASWVTKPDIAITLEACHAPMPGIEPIDTIEMEKVAISRGSNVHPGVFRFLTEIAENVNVPHEVDVWMDHSGLDVWNIQNQLGGIAAGIVSLPIRYMHSSVETVSLETLHNCARLLAETVARIDADWEETICSNN